MNSNKTPTVLIIEDEPVCIASLAGILGDACELVISQNMSEARSLLTDDIDVVLLDLYLPDGSGLSFLKELRASESYAYLPVICISGSDQAKDIEESFRHGATDYVLKPFNKTILSAKVSTFIDLKRKTDLLATAVLTDPLTNIGNRRLFDQQLDLEWRRARRQNSSVGLILIDLDHFKQINDQHGHAQGDLCLQQLSRVMSKSFSRAGEVAARLGGDEFAALIPEADLRSTITAANNFASALQTELSKCPSFAGIAPPVTVSIGCSATQPSSLSTAVELLAAADRSLYEAKEQGGRDCVRPIL
ncbi:MULTISPECIES: diguanylate cyclase [unclassified Marinobacter]|uniref:GGDEF domain-containing response regulator n=1 Tax=unclassified Marinobacter TaxID=83889 RepID=UPI0026E13276|nr:MULTISPECIES: diguanylate cyclase [unclassified Marinobacter]MDO6443377.1 diguanylate cyclase [Marinobacter sp. 2_MG-2023]MDO6824225.1 diguanylate cyclase [Marinobacter sp. 1_MG-2023]